VEGQAVTVHVYVEPSPYTLEISPTTLNQNTPVNVNFTVMQGGAAVGAGKQVVFSANANFRNLPTAAQMTDDNGTFTVTGLTALVSGAQTLAATVEGQDVTVHVYVNPSPYTLEISPTTLNQNTPATAVFTVKQGTAAVDAGKQVVFAANANFRNLPTAAQITNGSGQVTVPSLTALISGHQTLEATVEGQAVTVSVYVNPAPYTLKMAPAALTQNAATFVTFTVEQSGNPVTGKSVTFEANANFRNLPTAGQTTDSNGQFTLNNLAALVSGSQTLSATVEGQIVTVSVYVEPAPYTLEMNPATLDQNVATFVTFTVKQGGSAVGAGKKVAFAANANFSGLPEGEQMTGDNGAFTVNALTALVSGAHTLAATVEGQAVTVHVYVEPAPYTLDLSPTALIKNCPGDVNFSVRQGGSEADAGKQVVFAANANFSGLPESAQTTGTDGAFTVNSLTALVSGSQTLTATVNGQAVTVHVYVNPAPYTLEMTSPAALTQNTAASVTFTVKQGGVAVTTSKRVTFAANANFSGLPESEQTTGAGGAFTVNPLTALVSGAQTLTATVEGQAVTVHVYVNPAPYTLEMNPATLTQNTAASVIFTVKQGGAKVDAGKQVVFTANANFSGLPESAQTIGTGGSFTVNNLTALVPGSQTIEATVEGQDVTVSVYVNPLPYTLEISPATLTRTVATPVTFTVKQGGAAVTTSKAVTFAANANFIGLPESEQTTDISGRLPVINLTALVSGSQTLSATVEGQAVTVAVNVAPLPYELVAYGISGGGDFTSSATATIKVLLLSNGAPCITETATTWSIVSAANYSPALVSGYGSRTTGLAWGASAPATPENALTATTSSSTSPSDGTASISLTDVMGQRTVAVQAKVTIAGQDYTVTQNVPFGNGPLSAFSSSPIGQRKWMQAVADCGGTLPYPLEDGYHSYTELHNAPDLEAVSKGVGKGAAFAAGWHTVGTDRSYWTGTSRKSDSYASYVNLDTGLSSWNNAGTYARPVAVCLH
jgi:hypothetical protein